MNSENKENQFISYKKVGLCLVGSFILAFGLCHVHSQSLVTEGGALGLVLLFEKWWNVSPALSGFIMNAACYAFAIKTFGKKFLVYSAVACGGFSLFYAILECFNPFFPHLKEYPLLASILGALFVGVGVGLCLLAGGAPSGDDGLVLSLSKIFKIDIRWVYLFFDIVVLALSLTYIPLARILYSLLTVFLSGQIIGIMLKIAKKP